MPRWSRLDPLVDRQLVQDLGAGEAAARALVFDRYAERLYDYCRSFVDDPWVAADVVHDTLIDAFARADRLRDRRRLRAWLYAGARRRCLDLLRRRAHGPAAVAARVPACAVLAALPLAERDALLLAERHRLSVPDLAAVTGRFGRRADRLLRHARTRFALISGELERSRPVAEPAPEVPAGLRARVLHTATDPELAVNRTEIRARGGPLDPDGFPRQRGAPSVFLRRWRVVGLAEAAVLIALVLTLRAAGPGGVPGPEPAPGQAGPRGPHPGAPVPGLVAAPPLGPGPGPRPGGTKPPTGSPSPPAVPAPTGSPPPPTATPSPSPSPSGSGPLDPLPVPLPTPTSLIPSPPLLPPPPTLSDPGGLLNLPPILDLRLEATTGWVEVCP